jgi:hypothetical protein
MKLSEISIGDEVLHPSFVQGKHIRKSHPQYFGEIVFIQDDLPKARAKVHWNPDPLGKRKHTWIAVQRLRINIPF